MLIEAEVEVAPAYTACTVVHASVPCAVGIVLTRTPPEAVDTKCAECTIGATKATRKSCKASDIAFFRVVGIAYCASACI